MGMVFVVLVHNMCSDCMDVHLYSRVGLIRGCTSMCVKTLVNTCNICERET